MCYNIDMYGREVIGRFAPTPSGSMHVGNLLCAIVAYLSSKSKGGKFIIRIEDVDAPRCTRRAASDILEMLEALGIKSDEPVVYQSERAHAYCAAIRKIERAARVYPCFCTRAQLHAEGVTHLPDGGALYSQKCKSLTREAAAELMRTETPSLRLSVPDEAIEFTDGIYGSQAQNLARECGDFVILRRDGIYAYQLAVVVDDGESGVTEVVRGADLLYDTPRQIYLQRLLGLPTPDYFHIPLAVDARGRKLSKSDGDSAALLLKRMPPREVIGALACAVGLIDESRPVTLDELVPLYSPRKLPRDNIVLPRSLVSSDV